jgi:hypothetical protein
VDAKQLCERIDAALAGLEGDTGAVRSLCFELANALRAAEEEVARLRAAGARPLPPLTVGQILAWADAHYARTGRWPRAASGPVEGAPGEVWANVNAALYKGRRGLPRGGSLAQLLAENGRGRDAAGG